MSVDNKTKEKTMQYKEWLDGWLENYVKPASKQRTYARYRDAIENHITARLGDMCLSELTPYTLQCFVTELLRTGNLKTGTGLSPSSVNVIITIMKASLKTAFSLGMTNEYTADKLKRPRLNEKRIECFTVAEQKQIEGYILERERIRLYGIILCLYTGLRLGELLALEWGDIDFASEEMHITKACHDGIDDDGMFKRLTHTPKTHSSIRIIPLPKQVISLLKKAKAKSKSSYVVSSGEKGISLRAYQQSFAVLLRRLNITHRGFHALRHTFATRALECGMDVKTLSEILGHKNSAITLNRYAHSLTKHKKEMMNLVGKLL